MKGKDEGGKKVKERGEGRKVGKKQGRMELEVEGMKDGMQ